jgi:hypothetical protein
VTVSLGLVELEAGVNSEQLLARADVALYAAKQSGRNRTEWPGRHARPGKARRTPPRRDGTKRAGSRGRR